MDEDCPGPIRNAMLNGLRADVAAEIRSFLHHKGCDSIY
jgi:hypothetical protein